VPYGWAGLGWSVSQRIAAEVKFLKAEIISRCFPFLRFFHQQQFTESVLFSSWKNRLLPLSFSGSSRLDELLILLHCSKSFGQALCFKTEGQMGNLFLTGVLNDTFTFDGETIGIDESDIRSQNTIQRYKFEPCINLFRVDYRCLGVSSRILWIFFYK